MGIVAKLTFTQDFFSSSGGRLTYSIAKTAMKVFLGVAVCFLIFSLLAPETESKGDGPKVTHKAIFDITVGGEAIGSKLDFSEKPSPKLSKISVSFLERPNQMDMPIRYFTVRSKTLCFKVVTLPEETEPVEFPSMEINLLMRTSS